MTVTLTVRMDPDLKARFSAIVESVGLDAPTVVRMLAVQTVRQKAIPLSLTAPDQVDHVNPRPTAMAWPEEVEANWSAW